MNLADEIEKRILALAQEPDRGAGGILLPWKIRAERDLSDFLNDHAANIVDALRNRPEASSTKVFVIIGGWDYEGYTSPTGVYSSRELADAAVAHARANHSYDDLDVLEYTVDHGEREEELSKPQMGEP